MLKSLDCALKNEHARVKVLSGVTLVKDWRVTLESKRALPPTWCWWSNNNTNTHTQTHTHKHAHTLATDTSLTIFASHGRVPTQDTIFTTCRLLPGPLTLNNRRTLKHAKRVTEGNCNAKRTDAMLFHSTRSSLHTDKN